MTSTSSMKSPSVVSEISNDVEFLSVDVLQVLENNSRVHEQHQIELISDAIRRDGFTTALTVRKNDDQTYTILAGNGRFKAALAVGLCRLPCVVVDMDDFAAKRLAVWDNLSAELSSWESDALKHDLNYLREGGEDLDALGLSLQDVADMEPPPPPPEVPPSHTYRLQFDSRDDLDLFGAFLTYCCEQASMGEGPALIEWIRENVDIRRLHY